MPETLGVSGRERSPHPLPQPLGLCTLGFQLLPPLGGSGVGLSQGARQLVVAVLQREELGLPLHLAHGAAGTRGSAGGRARRADVSLGKGPALTGKGVGVKAD